jgi:hypothetical protein
LRSGFDDFFAKRGAPKAKITHLPTTLGLLAILDRKTSKALPMILKAAKQARADRIIKAYEAAGIASV